MKNISKMKFCKKLIQITLLVFLLILSQACNESPNNPVESKSFASVDMNLQKNTILPKSEIKLEKVVNHIAKSLALLLNDKAVREILAVEIENITNKQKLIDMIDLLKKNLIINSKSVKLLDKLTEYIVEKEKNDFNSSINNIPSKYLYLGFPSQKQREQWLASEDVLVAAVGDRLDGDESDVIAYNSKGQKIDLVANELPIIPTLVVRTDGSLTNKLTSALLPEEGGGGGGGSTTTQYDVYLKGFTVGTNHDAFWDNSMELYFLVSAMNSDGTWGPWWSVTNPIEGFVTDEFKDLGFHGIGIFSTLQQNFKIRIQVWDADAGSSDDLVSDGYSWQINGSIVEYIPNYIQPGSNTTWEYTEVANPDDIDVMDILQRIHN